MKKIIGIILLAAALIMIVMNQAKRGADSSVSAVESSGEVNEKTEVEEISVPGELVTESGGSLIESENAPTDPDESISEEVDPLAHTSRNWEDYIQMPDESQIEAANGHARSPYIAFYMSYPGIKKAEEYCVDFHADHQPIGTYICPITWWTELSILREKYESVYNDYSDEPGGYCGFQRLQDGSRVFIMSVWDIFCRDSEGNVDLIVPTVIYPENQGQAFEGDLEGSFVQCIIPYDWRPGRDYRLLLQQSISETTGNVVWTTWVCDLAEGNWTKLVSFDVGSSEVNLGSTGGFLENYIEDYAGDVRTMELSNFKARAAGSSEWIPAESVQVRYNASLGIDADEYIGSANYGTDGASFWAITSGVNGIGRETEEVEDFALEPGDTSDPYE